MQHLFGAACGLGCKAVNRANVVLIANVKSLHNNFPICRLFFEGRCPFIAGGRELQPSDTYSSMTGVMLALDVAANWLVCAVTVPAAYIKAATTKLCLNKTPVCGRNMTNFGRKCRYQLVAGCRYFFASKSSLEICRRSRCRCRVVLCGQVATGETVLHLPDIRSGGVV